MIARVFGESSGQTVEIEWRADRHRHVPERRAAEDGVGAVVLVERVEDDDFVTRLHDRHEGGDHRLGGTAGDGDIRLGFTVMPYHSAYLRASASRSRREPR